MSFHVTDDPADLSLDAGRFHRALSTASEWCDNDLIPGMALTIGRPGVVLRPRYFGHQHPDRADPLREDAIFTVASITKPIVAMGAMLLVERGQMTLSDKVSDLVPEFRGKGRYNVRVQHLLTHTSGLPDLLPNDRDLRRANVPLTTFLAETAQAELTFPSGRGVAYSSCGYLLLGELISRITRKPLPEFLRTELFEPLGMQSTLLGLPRAAFDEPKCDLLSRLAPVRVPPEQDGGDSWNWNSRYWRTLGAPWGGLLATPADLANFAHVMLSGGRDRGTQFFSQAVVQAATANQLAGMREVPEPDRRCRAWGFGWRLNWPAHGAYFGDLLSSSAYGHWGATGTLLWIDPQKKAFAVILTTQPQDPAGTYLARLSNMIAAAILSS